MNTSFYGRLTKDPVQQTNQQTGNAYTTFTVAVQMPVKKPNSDEYVTIFPYVSAFSRTGEFVSKYFRKGSRIVVHGEVRNIYIGQDNDGRSYSNISITAHSVDLVDTKTEAEAQQQGQAAPPPQQQAAPPPPQQQQAAPPPQQGYTYYPNGQQQAAPPPQGQQAPPPPAAQGQSMWGAQQQQAAPPPQQQQAPPPNNNYAAAPY